MAFIIQGVKILFDCRYIKFQQSNKFLVEKSPATNSAVIYYKKGMTSKNIVTPEIIAVDDVILTDLDYTKISTPKINLGGVIFTKLTQSDYIFKQYIVDGIDKFKMRVSSDYCEILIPSKRQTDIESYLLLLSKNPYIQLIPSKLEKLYNFDLICIRDFDITINTGGDLIHKISSEYDKFILSPIMIQSEFITQLNGIVKDYGLELVRLPIDKLIESNNRLSYKFTDIGKSTSRKDLGIFQYIQSRQDHIEFTLSTPDLRILDDFKTRYQNLNLISNFTEFYTMDKYGRSYKSTVWWNPISTDFNQAYNTDSNGNVGFEIGFSADIFYDTIYDEKLIKITKTIESLVSMDDNMIII